MENEYIISGLVPTPEGIKLYQEKIKTSEGNPSNIFEKGKKNLLKSIKQDPLPTDAKDNTQITLWRKVFAQYNLVKTRKTDSLKDWDLDLS